MTPLTPRRPTVLSAPFSRPPLDPSLRRRTYGPIRPMDCDLAWWERLFRR